MEKIGDRVGAIQKADINEVHLYGYGVYQGQELPAKGAFDFFGQDAHELGIKNPKILLDNGNIVWGAQCWWGSEEKIKEAIGNRKIILV